MLFTDFHQSKISKTGILQVHTSYRANYLQSKFLCYFGDYLIFTALKLTLKKKTPPKGKCFSIK